VQGFTVALAEHLQEARQQMVSESGLARNGTYDAP
jgi:hypothetical protein